LPYLQDRTKGAIEFPFKHLNITENYKQEFQSAVVFMRCGKIEREAKRRVLKKLQ